MAGKPKLRSKPGLPATAAERPDAVGNLLCRRVRELRKRRGWTLEEMSAACGVSRSMLSEIERQRANPTLAVAFRIAQAFGMSLGDLVEEPALTPKVEVIRADDRTYHYRSDAFCRIRTLSPLHLEKSVEYYEVVLKVRRRPARRAPLQGARELLTVQQGTIRVTSGPDSANLNRGDSAHYPADVPHAIENPGTDDAVLFLVVTYERD